MIYPSDEEIAIGILHYYGSGRARRQEEQMTVRRYRYERNGMFYDEYGSFVASPDYDALAERADKLHKALRGIALKSTEGFGCWLHFCGACRGRWQTGEPERHAEGCLAAPPSTGGA